MTQANELVGGVDDPFRVLFSFAIKLCGAVQILVGTLCLVGARELLTPSVRSSPEYTVGLLFGTMGIWQCGLGLGVLGGARWACSLSQATAWLWFVLGLCVFVREDLIHDAVVKHAVGSGDFGATYVCGLQSMAIAVRTLFFVLVPFGIASTYTLSQTLGGYGEVDAGTDWAVRHPMPELLLSGLFAISAAILGYYVYHGAPFPFFGTLSTGKPGTVLGIFVVLGMVLLSVAHWRNLNRTWIFSAILCIAFGTSVMLTFTRVDISEFYLAMGMPTEELARIAQTEPGSPRNEAARFNGTLWMLGILCLIVYRRLCSAYPQPTRS